MTSQLQKLFEEMKTAMIQKEKNILSDIQSIEKKQLADITKVKKKMEKRRDEAMKHLLSLQMIREEPDIFLFFKVSSGILLFFMNMADFSASQLLFLEITLTIFSLFFFVFNPVCRNLKWPRTGMFHLKTPVSFFERIWCS